MKNEYIKCILILGCMLCLGGCQGKTEELTNQGSQDQNNVAESTQALRENAETTEEGKATETETEEDVLDTLDWAESIAFGSVKHTVLLSKQPKRIVSPGDISIMCNVVRFDIFEAVYNETEDQIYYRVSYVDSDTKPFVFYRGYISAEYMEEVVDKELEYLEDHAERKEIDLEPTSTYQNENEEDEIARLREEEGVKAIGYVDGEVVQIVGEETLENEVPENAFCFLVRLLDGTEKTVPKSQTYILNAKTEVDLQSGQEATVMDKTGYAGIVALPRYDESDTIYLKRSAKVRKADLKKGDKLFVLESVKGTYVDYGETGKASEEIEKDFYFVYSELGVYGFVLVDDVKI